MTRHGGPIGEMEDYYNRQEVLRNRYNTMFFMGLITGLVIGLALGLLINA